MGCSFSKFVAEFSLNDDISKYLCLAVKIKERYFQQITENLICYVMLCYVMLCYVMLCYVMLCYVMLCYVMLCYVMLCYVMLCCVVLCCIVLCYGMVWNNGIVWYGIV